MRADVSISDSGLSFPGYYIYLIFIIYIYWKEHLFLYFDYAGIRNSKPYNNFSVHINGHCSGFGANKCLRKGHVSGCDILSFLDVRGIPFFGENCFPHDGGAP